MKQCLLLKHGSTMYKEFKSKMGELQMEYFEVKKEEFLSKLYTRREAEEYLKINSVALQHHIRKGNIIPCKEYGKASGKVQLFWESDLDYLKENHVGK